MTEDLRKRLGQRLKELRKTAGLTQEELSDKIGVYRTDLSAFESKGEKIGSLEKVNELFEALGYELTVAEKKPHRFQCRRRREGEGDGTMGNLINITFDNMLRIAWLLRCDTQFEDQTPEDAINNILTKYIEQRGLDQEIQDAEERRKNRDKIRKEGF